MSCTGQPLSWLTLERYHLGELPEPQSRRIQEHIGSCDACRGCLEQIQTDHDHLVLPPLPEPVPEKGAWSGWLPRFGWAAAAAALATVIIVVLLRIYVGGPPRQDGALPAPSRVGFKGGELAISLVRERKGAILHDPTTFAPGDRFKALITCAPDQRLLWDLVVLQGEERSFPLKPAGPLLCGNRQPLPGAFTITGKLPAVVCLVASERQPDRGQGLPSKGVVCVSLAPVP